MKTVPGKKSNSGKGRSIFKRYNGTANTKVARTVCDFLVHLPVEREADSFSLVPTCTTTAMLVTGDALAVAVLEKKGLTREQFAELHPSGSLGRKLLLQIGDIMHAGEKNPLVHLGMTLREAVCIMGEKRLGVAFVVDPIAPEKLLGIITDGDLRRLLSQNANPLGERVEKVMTADPITVDSQELAVTAVNMMQNNKITVLPVMQVFLQQFVQSQAIRNIWRFADRWQR